MVGGGGYLVDFLVDWACNLLSCGGVAVGRCLVRWQRNLLGLIAGFSYILCVGLFVPQLFGFQVPPSLTQCAQTRFA